MTLTARLVQATSTTTEIVVEDEGGIIDNFYGDPAQSQAIADAINQGRIGAHDVFLSTHQVTGNQDMGTLYEKAVKALGK